MSRVQTIELEYTETWEQGTGANPLLQTALKWQLEENRKRLAAAQNDAERKLIQ